MSNENHEDSCELFASANSAIDTIYPDSPDDADSTGYNEKIANEKLEQLKEDRNLRREYADKVFWFISLWSIGLFLILIGNGLRTFGFHLSDAVMITLLTTSFVEVLGLFYFVMSYLFAKEVKTSKINKFIHK